MFQDAPPIVSFALLTDCGVPWAKRAAMVSSMARNASQSSRIA